MSMGDKEYIKTCSNCGGLQSYTTKSRLKCSIRENWVCNNCSSTHMKKIYSDEVVNESVKLYTDGISFSKIATILKIGRDNVKDILIKNNVWVENRDNLKIEFNDVEINDVLIKYRNGLSVQKICKLYNVSRTPIQKILKDKGILKKGHSNGIKINLTEEQKEKIKHLYLNEYKTSLEIGKELGLTGSFIDKYLDKCGYRRSVSEGVSVGLVKRYRGTSYDKYLDIQNDFKKYKNDVMKITRQQPINELTNYDKRGKSGVEGFYHLDHKYSILEGFKNGISPDIIGGIMNLEFIPWKENIKKRTKCSITINELIL